VLPSAAAPLPDFGFAVLPLFAALQAGAGSAHPPRPSLTDSLMADAHRQPTARRGPLVPTHLVSEALPALDGQLEARIAALTDFNAAVLSSHQAEWAQVERQTRDVFDARHVSESDDENRLLLARLDDVAISGRVDRQLSLFGEVQRNLLLVALTEHFRDALMRNNIRPPDDPDELDRRLDLVLAHHPELLRNAFKRARLKDLFTREVELPAVIGFDSAGTEARRNAYGRLPDDLNGDEMAFARLLDAEANVRWWHRNPVRRPSSVALFGWDHGDGFYPDFVVSIDGRKSEESIVLVEIKGPLLWDQPTEALKIAGGRHPRYGEVVAIGRRAGQPFKRLTVDGTRLTPIGDFDFAQLRLAAL
ncbi:MAG: hypothetical protein M3414_08635, partial [Pseudomonadota bacterium]|nr:hypothetical protein [Pseudomonadota bacterium]